MNLFLRHKGKVNNVVISYADMDKLCTNQGLRMEIVTETDAHFCVTNL